MRPAGGTLAYRATVHNAGPSAATGSAIAFTLPAGLTATATSGCTGDPTGSPGCLLPELPAGAEARVELQVAVAAELAGQTVQVLAEQRGSWSGFSWPQYRYLEANTKTLAGLAAYNSVGASLSRGESTWNVLTGMVSENFFELIGTGFAAGRGFSPATGGPHDPAPEIVLHYETWMTRFGGDSNVVDGIQRDARHAAARATCG